MVTTEHSEATAGRPALKRGLFRGDRIIWVVFFLLSIISLVEVYSSIGLYAYSMSGQDLRACS